MAPVKDELRERPDTLDGDSEPWQGGVTRYRNEPRRCDVDDDVIGDHDLLSPTS